MTPLGAAAVAVLEATTPEDKIRLTRSAVAAWRLGRLVRAAGPPPPAVPGRPARPCLVPPTAVPKRRRAGGRAGRIALLHAIAHIEFNAIDLAWDVVARFDDPGLPVRFVDDWVAVAADEAEHFGLISDRLAAVGARYGDLPAHDGLWQAARATRDDLTARLAVVPLVLEARGLDVTPGMIESLARAGDHHSAAALSHILSDEVGHVGAGVRWFHYLCARTGRAPRATWQSLVQKWSAAPVKPPFNDTDRWHAGLPAGYYWPLAATAPRGPDRAS